MIPGEIRPAAGEIELLADRRRTSLRVSNGGDRPVQVGSHYHFAEANPALVFDRHAAWGMRLDIAAGSAVRFEPGVERDVELVVFAGERRVPGLRRAAAGPLDGADLVGGFLRAGIDTEEPA